MNTGADFVPILTSIFICVFALIDNYFATNYSMRLFIIINIVKCRLSFLYICNPRPHMFRIRSERMIDIVFVYFTKLFQRL